MYIHHSFLYIHVYCTTLFVSIPRYTKASAIQYWKPSQTRATKCPALCCVYYICMRCLPHTTSITYKCTQTYTHTTYEYIYIYIYHAGCKPPQTIVCIYPNIHSANATISVHIYIYVEKPTFIYICRNVWTHTAFMRYRNHTSEESRTY